MAHPRPASDGPCLILGASGGFGSILADHLEARGIEVRRCRHATAMDNSLPVDLVTGEGLPEAFNPLPASVINCAAMSSPASCERDKEQARAVNVPTRLLTLLRRAREEHGKKVFLIHMSTDQVYEGNGTPESGWSEEDEAATRAINAYGQTKREAEREVDKATPEGDCAILRCSAIISRNSAFLKAIVTNFSQGEAMPLLQNELRNFILAEDLCVVIHRLLLSGRCGWRLVNAGGGRALSRLDFGRAVAGALGVDERLAKPAQDGEVERNYESPQNLTLNLDRLRSLLGREVPHIHPDNLRPLIREIEQTRKWA